MANRFDKLLDERRPAADGLAKARALLIRPERRDAAWPALAAAAVFCASALTFAVVVVLAPAPQSEIAGHRHHG